MKIARTIKEVKEIISQYRRKKGGIIGFVPTMGALHLGHLSLVRRARVETDFVVVSIFVNPLQFGPHEDYRQYPRDFKSDEVLLKREGVDLIFYPTPRIMYPSSFSTYVEETSLSKVLCGKSRPTHFRGVTTVVAKLFNLIGPDISYFGQKDYQQAQIIKRMVQDLNFSLKIKVLPIVREPDGLAMSSRNAYLNPEERKDAPVLFEALKLCKKLILEGERDAGKLKKKMKKFISLRKTARVDYVEIVEAENLKRMKRLKGRVLIGLAVFINKTRLIDNMLVSFSKKKVKFSLKD